MENREAIRHLIKLYDNLEKFFSQIGYHLKDEYTNARTLAIYALEKQEQVNTQSVNLTHTTYPNALESLKILESAKDENGCVPMSLVRLAFRNVFEQDRWVPVKERLPEEDCECRVTFENDFGKSVFNCYWNEGEKQFESWDYFLDCFVPVFGVTAWKPMEEPYTEEE